MRRNTSQPDSVGSDPRPASRPRGSPSHTWHRDVTRRGATRLRVAPAFRPSPTSPPARPTGRAWRPPAACRHGAPYELAGARPSRLRNTPATELTDADLRCDEHRQAAHLDGADHGTGSQRVLVRPAVDWRDREAKTAPCQCEPFVHGERERTTLLVLAKVNLPHRCRRRVPEWHCHPPASRRPARPRRGVCRARTRTACRALRTDAPRHTAGRCASRSARR